MQGEGGESPEWPRRARLPAADGGVASPDLSSLAAGLLGFRGEVRECGEGLK